jgi:CzcA family heavy metal efflux pump
MMRRIINTSLRFRVLLTAAAVGVLFLGLTQLPKASQDIYPEFAPPYVEVQTEALGLSANEVEQMITVPLEADLLNGVAWVKDIRSESVPGLSSITLIFEPGTSLFRARQAVQERLAQAHALPNVSKPPQMLQPVSSTSRTMMIGLSSSKLSLIEISQLARWTIKPRLMGVEGVANVSSFGQRERQLQVQVDPKQLHDKGVALQDVVETTGNALWVSPLSYLEASTPGTGGFIETPRQRLGVRHVSPIESAEDLAQVALPPKEGAGGAGAALKLGDVATVVEDHQPLIGDASVNNGTGLLLVVEKLRDANTVDVTKGVEAALDSLRPALRDLRVDSSIYRPADYIKRASDNVGKAALVGLALLILLVALAFYQWRVALVATATVLVSLVAAAVVLDLRGTTFNTMTVAGLALALGVIIDDALAGTERVVRAVRQGGGEAPVLPMVLGSFLEIRGPLTFAAVLVLLPIVPVYFMGDLFGAFGRPLATSYAIAVLVSTLVALTLTPALAVILLSKSSHAGRQSPVMAAVTRRYDGLVGRLLRAPSKAYILAGVLAVIGLVALPQIRQSRLPALEERDFLMEVETTPGSSLAKTNAITSDITNELRGIPGVRNVASHAGRAVTGDQVVGVNSSKLWISLDPKADYDKTVKAVKQVAANHKDLDLDLSSYSQSRIKDSKEGADSPIVVRVYGNERDALAAKAKEVGDELRKVSGLIDLNVELPAEEPSLEVAVDLDRAKDFGVKPGDVRRSAAILLSGIDVGQLFYDQKVFDVVVWGTPETRKNTDDVKNLLIDTPTGGQVRLEQVADVNVVSSPDVIEREGVFRRIDISARVSGRSRDAVAADVEKTIKGIDFPLEYRAELLGNFAEKQAAERRLLGLGAFAALAVLLLLQSAFGSWRVGAALFLTVPVSLVGGVAAALALGGKLTIGAAVGLLTVLGIAGRHGILLLRRFQQLERREGLPFGSELVRRGATERLAPTLLSTVALALAVLPLAVLSHRPGLEILHPMAIVVLGGLVSSTLVTVFILPVLYLAVAGGASATELDLRLFEEELLAEAEPVAQPRPATVAANGNANGTELVEQ